MSELQAILERRRQRADATRGNGGDVGGGDANDADTGAVVTATPTQTQHPQRSRQQYSQSSVNEDAKDGEVTILPTPAGRATSRINTTNNFVPMPPSQLPTRIHASNANAPAAEHGFFGVPKVIE